MDVLYLLVAILLSILLAILLFNYVFYKYYADPTDSYSLATITVVTSLSIGFLCVLLIPIDIFLTTSWDERLDKIAEIVRMDRTYFKEIMLVIYALAIFVAFFLVPFAYFYGDERIEDIVPQESEMKQKICNSLKYTLFFNLFCAIILVFGLFFKQADSSINHMKTGDKFKWIHNLFDTEHRKFILISGGEQAISFVISSFSVVGMVCLIFYTGYGLGALPFYLIKGKKSLSTAHLEYEMDKAEIRDRIRNLQEKLSRRGHLSNKEKRELSKLRDEELNVDRKLSRITGLLESERLINKLLAVLTPFRVIIGVVCLVLSLLIFVSLFITSLDRYLHSKCGLNCGYVLDDKNYTNYLDSLLLYSSKFFHLDYLLFAIINVYAYICSIYGFVKLGIKLFFFTWFEIRKQSTNPQGLLVMSFLMCLMIISFILEMLTLAPQYSTFGTQSFSKHSVQGEIPCKLSLISGKQNKECVMTNISKFYNRISISLPFFSTIFYLANWLLIAIMGVSLLYAAFFREEEVLDDYTEQEDDEETKMLASEF